MVNLQLCMPLRLSDHWVREHTCLNSNGSSDEDSIARGSIGSKGSTDRKNHSRSMSMKTWHQYPISLQPSAGNERLNILTLILLLDLPFPHLVMEFIERLDAE